MACARFDRGETQQAKKNTYHVVVIWYVLQQYHGTLFVLPSSIVYLCTVPQRVTHHQNKKEKVSVGMKSAGQQRV